MVCAFGGKLDRKLLISEILRDVDVLLIFVFVALEAGFHSIVGKLLLLRT